MLKLNDQEISSIYFNNQKINRYYFNGVMYEFYKPYIEYKWPDTITRNGLQEIENSGTFELGLIQYFGQGVRFNGVDQAISIGSVPVSDNMTLAYSFVPNTNSRILGRSDWNTFVGFSTVSRTEGVVRCRFTGIDMVFTYRLTLGVPYNITLVLKPDVIDLWVNGILRESIEHTYRFAHPLEFIGRNSKAFANCVIKDIYVYNKHLTQTEIEKYNNQPNQFFMDALEDSTCVLAMPMCEKDGYIRNYVSYKKADFLMLKKDISSTSAMNNTRIGQENIGLLVEAGKTYEIAYDFTPNVNFVEFRLYIPPISNNGVAFSVAVPISQFSGKYLFTVPSTYTQTNGSTSCYVWIGINKVPTTHLFREISVKEVEGFPGYTETRLGTINPNILNEANFFPVVASRSLVDGKIRVTDNVTTTNSPRVLYAENNVRVQLIPGRTYMATVEIGSYLNISSVVLKANCDIDGNHVSFTGTGNILNQGRVHFIFTPTDVDRMYFCITSSGNAEGCYFDIAYFDLQELAGIHQIANFTTACRTNAQRLSYGLQTSGFKRDSNGLILGKSGFLEADGVGYENTGWIPKWNEDFTVETVFEVSNDSGFRLNGNSYNKGIYFGKHSVGKKLYVRVFGSPAIKIDNTKDIVCLTFSYNWQSKEVKQYVDGVLVTTQLASQTTNVSLPVLLGMVSVTGTYPVIKPVRLFKTHSKVLTQEEVTKNFNKYQAQGLLSESGLPPESTIPNYAIIDEEGNYLTDEDGNFITWE